MPKKKNDKRVPLPLPLFEMELESGRKIMAVQVHTGFTYGTHQVVLGGKSRIKKINMTLITNDYPARVLWSRGFPAILLNRVEHLKDLERAFPMYKMTALFESEPTGKKESGYSALVVNWFQDQPAPLFSRANRKALKSIDWDDLADDYDV